MIAIHMFKTCRRVDKVIVSVAQAMQELATAFRSPLPSAVLPNAILTIRG